MVSGQHSDCVARTKNSALTAFLDVLGHLPGCSNDFLLLWMRWDAFSHRREEAQAFGNLAGDGQHVAARDDAALDSEAGGPGTLDRQADRACRTPFVAAMQQKHRAFEALRKAGGRAHVEFCRVGSVEADVLRKAGKEGARVGIAGKGGGGAEGDVASAASIASVPHPLSIWSTLASGSLNQTLVFGVKLSQAKASDGGSP